MVITVLADDIDPDGDAFAAGMVRDAPLHRPVTVQADMTLLYVPGRDFDGSDIFVGAASDGRLSDEASVTVNEVNDQPNFAAAVTRLVVDGTQPGSPVGSPVTAADVDVTVMAAGGKHLSPGERRRWPV